MPALDSKIADQVIRGPPRLRAAGLLHDPFEALQLEYEHGAKADIICFFVELCAGKHCPSGGVHSDSALLILDVRAVCFYKDETCTSLRPLGIGECLRRAALCCYTKQRKSTWEFFYTNMLPEDQAARDAAIEEAAELLAEVDASLVDAELFGTAAQVAACKEKVLAAQVAHAEAQAPANFPVNYCFSPNGTELTAMTVQSWVEAYPDRKSVV